MQVYLFYSSVCHNQDFFGGKGFVVEMKIISYWKSCTLNVEFLEEEKMLLQAINFCS